MKCLIRKQRNEVYTILFADNGEMPDDDSLDARYRDGVRIFGMAGPLGIGLLLDADLDYLAAMAVGETIDVELTAAPQYSIRQWWNQIRKEVQNGENQSGHQSS